MMRRSNQYQMEAPANNGRDSPRSPEFMQNKAKAMVSVEQGKQRIFGYSESLGGSGHYQESHGGKRMMGASRVPVNNIF